MSGILHVPWPWIWYRNWLWGEQRERNSVKQEQPAKRPWIETYTSGKFKEKVGGQRTWKDQQWEEWEKGPTHGGAIAWPYCIQATVNCWALTLGDIRTHYIASKQEIGKIWSPRLRHWFINIVMEFRATRQKSEVYQTSVASEEVAFIVHMPEIEIGCHWLCGLPSAISLFWACLPIWKLDNKISQTEWHKFLYREN